MRVLLFAKHDVAGGACRSSYRLHKGLRRLGVDSKIAVLEKRSLDTDVRVYVTDQDFTSRLRYRVIRWFGNRLLRPYRYSRPPNAEHFSVDLGGYGKNVFEQLGGADVVNIHWGSGFIDVPKILRELPSGVPVVFTLHDMNIFTGGCHYSGSCVGFQQNCGCCPQLGSSSPRDISSKMLARKKHAVQSRRRDCLKVVTPSRWLAEQAESSAVFTGVPVDVIPYGIETDVFKRHPDPVEARLALGISVDAPVVAFVSGTLINHRKGFDILQKALEQIARELDNVHLLTLAAGRSVDIRGVTHVNAGLIENSKLMAFCLSAADVFAMPTREDNLPNTVLEAMSCGLPVVGTDVGGVPDMVDHAITGLIVPPEDPDRFADALLELLKNPDTRTEMGRRAREKAESDYCLMRQANDYLSVYNRF